MADLLERMAFACELGIALASPEKATPQSSSEREAVEPGFTRYAEEARELAGLYRARQDRRRPA